MATMDDQPRVAGARAVLSVGASGNSNGHPLRARNYPVYKSPFVGSRRVNTDADEDADWMDEAAADNEEEEEYYLSKEQAGEGDNDEEPQSDTAKCFSCMSKLYEAVWPLISHVYKRPLNFTDECNAAQLDPASVPTVHCSTICLSMWEEPAVAGVRIHGHIRGCLDDLLHNGFNASIVAWHRWMHRDSCRDYRKRELFKLPPEQSDDSSIHVCTCYADHCNSGSTSGAGATRVGYWALLLLLALVAHGALDDTYRATRGGHPSERLNPRCLPTAAISTRPGSTSKRRKRRRRAG